jgi:DNA-directed RNA polymerase subunit beta'
MSLRRDLPSVGRFGEHREEFIVTTLEAKDGAVVKPGTTIIKTEIGSHADGLVEYNQPGEGREVRRLILITPEHETVYPVSGKAKVKEGDMIREGDELAAGTASKDTGRVRLADGGVAVRHGRPYLISSGTQLMVDAGEMVQRGENLATLVYDRVKTGDIIQGLPRVEELLEARKPKENAIVAEHTGTVKLMVDIDENVRVFIETEHGSEEYSIPVGGRLVVEDGDPIEKGQPVTDGPVNPHDVLRVMGVERVQRFLVDEVQMVYRSQGVEIADKHVEVIVRQMTRKMKVEDPGDTTLLPGEMVDMLELDREQQMITEGGRQAVTTPILLGITKASLNTESFISAASFQETTRVLTEAAIEGKKDWLHGLKENVVIGRLIPAGTGLFDQPEEEAPVGPEYLLPTSPSELIGAPRPVATAGGEDAFAEEPEESFSPGEAVMPEEGEE